MPAVKFSASGQVALPKRIQKKLGLEPGDYLEVEEKGGKVVLTPKTLVDKRIQKRLAESFEDFRKGRVYGPFPSAKEMVRSLHAGARQRKKRKPA